jgi:hypothetical protein
MDEFCRLATKYALCQDQLPEGVPTLKELKERFAMFDWCKDKASAAAFGYYAALEEFNGKEEEDDEPVIGDLICAIVSRAQDSLEDSTETMELIMGNVYNWLVKELEGINFPGFVDMEVEAFLKEQFSPYVKPGVIS